MYRVQYARSVLTKDMPKLKSANLIGQFLSEMELIKVNPFMGKLLTGPLKGKRSVRKAYCRHSGTILADSKALLS